MCNSRSARLRRGLQPTAGMEQRQAISQGRISALEARHQLNGTRLPSLLLLKTQETLTVAVRGGGRRLASFVRSPGRLIIRCAAIGGSRPFSTIRAPSLTPRETAES